MNHYHYESRKRRVVMRFVHTTGKTWYKVLYEHTMYVKSLSNISIKTNFKQITRVKAKCMQYSEEEYISCMTSRYLSFIQRCHVTVFSLTFQWYMTSWLRRSAEKVSCNVVPFFIILYRTLCIRQATFVNFKGKRT